MTSHELFDKYKVNYNTLRHILLQYIQSGRVDAQQFKRKIHKTGIKTSRIEFQSNSSKDMQIDYNRPGIENSSLYVEPEADETHMLGNDVLEYEDENSKALLP